VYLVGDGVRRLAGASLARGAGSARRADGAWWLPEYGSGKRSVAERRRQLARVEAQDRSSGQRKSIAERRRELALVQGQGYRMVVGHDGLLHPTD
jgi:hypothetical protein